MKSGAIHASGQQVFIGHPHQDSPQPVPLNICTALPSLNWMILLIQYAPHSFCSLGHFSSLLSFQMKSVFWMSSPTFPFLSTLSFWLDYIYFDTLQIYNSTLASHPFFQTHLSVIPWLSCQMQHVQAKLFLRLFFYLPMLMVTSVPQVLRTEPPWVIFDSFFFLVPNITIWHQLLFLQIIAPIMVSKFTLLC